MTTAVEPVASPTPETGPEAAAGRRAAWDQFGRVAVVTVLAATLAVSILITPSLAFRWRSQPFIGAFLEQTMVLNNTGAGGPAPWPAFAAGARPGDQLLAVDGVLWTAARRSAPCWRRKSRPDRGADPVARERRAPW